MLLIAKAIYHYTIRKSICQYILLQNFAKDINWNLLRLWRDATAKGGRGALAYYEGRQSPPISRRSDELGLSSAPWGAFSPTPNPLPKGEGAKKRAPQIPIYLFSAKAKAVCPGHTALIMLLYHSSTVRSFFVCGSLKRNTTAIVVNTISGTIYEPL